MTNQMNSIESLQTEVNQVKTDLDLLKAVTNETIKQTKAESLAQDVTATKEKIKKELDALKWLTDATSLENTRKLEAMLLTLETSTTELTTLKASVTTPLNSSEETPSELQEEHKEEQEDETKEKNWIKRQWDGVTSKEEWKTNTWANIARVAWGIGAVSLAVRWIKKLFGRGKKNKEKKEGEESTEKKGFRQKPLGKFLKWTGIGTGAYYLIHGFVTGKWNLKDFFDWNKLGADNHDESWEQVESYTERAEKNPEQKEKYESFWDTVDAYYESIFAKELDAGWEDDADMSSIPENVAAKNEGKNIDVTLKGVVPYCMDNSFSSVKSILSEKGIEVDIFQRDIAEIKTRVVWWIKWTLGKWLLWFLSVLPSFIAKGIGSTTEEKVENRISSGKREDRIAELKFFFRQQVRMTVYLNQKKNELIKKIAEEKLAVNNPENFESVEEALNDADRVEKEILNNADYTSFINGSILNAVDIMRKRDVFWDTPDEDVQKVVDEIDTQRDEIMDGTCGDDIITRCKADFEDDGKLETANSTVLTESCRNIINDITEEVEWPMEESMRNIYEDLRDSNDAQLRQLLKESPLLKMFGDIKQWLEDMILKIQNGTFTKEDLVSLKKVVNNYFAFKKELMIGANTFEQIKDENGNIVISLGKFLRGCLQNIWEGLFWGHGFREGAWYVVTWAIPIFTVVAGVLWFRKPKNRYKTWVAIYNTVPRVSQSLLRTTKTINRKYMWPPSMIRKAFFEGATGPTKLEASLMQGNISLRKASQIVDNGMNGKFVWRNTKSIRLTRYGANNNIDTIKKILMDKIFPTFKLVDDELEMVAKNFDNRTWNKLLLTSTNKDTINLMKKYEALQVSGEKKLFFDKILDSGDLSKSDIQKLIKYADDIDISNLETKELNKIAKKLSKEISNLADANAINAKITDLKKTVNVVDVLTDAQKACQKMINNKISVLQKQVWTLSGVEKKIMELDIDNLRKLAQDMKHLPDDEVKVLNNLLWTNVSMRYISKILSVDDPMKILSKMNAATKIDEFEIILKSAKNADVDDMIHALKSINKFDGFHKQFLKNVGVMSDAVRTLKNSQKLMKTLKILAKVPII